MLPPWNSNFPHFCYVFLRNVLLQFLFKEGDFVFRTRISLVMDGGARSASLPKLHSPDLPNKTPRFFPYGVEFLGSLSPLSCFKSSRGKIMKTLGV